MSSQDNKNREGKSDSESPAGENDSPLIGPGGEGGINASGGFNFQDRYIVALIPKLLSNPAFGMLFPEGTGDVDVFFAPEEAKELREHIQLKNYSVGKTDLRAVIDNFVKVDTAMPHVYTRFVLASNSLATDIKTLASRLERYRDAKPFYETTVEALDSTRKKVEETLAGLKLNSWASFIIEKVYFDYDLAVFNKDEMARNLFTARLQALPDYERIPPPKLGQIYDTVLTVISNSKGQVLKRSDLENLINDALKAPKTRPAPRVTRRAKDLSAFVDREKETENFSLMLKPCTRPIMLVSGDLGIGKSDLIFKMVQHCEDFSIINALLVRSDLRMQNYSDVMCKIRDEIGADYFDHFSETMAAWKSKDLEGDRLPEWDVEAIRDRAAAKMATLTDSFIECLAEATANQLAVIFIDDGEEMNEETRRWLWNELLRAAADGALNNVRFVLSWQTEFDDWRDIEHKVERTRLEPFCERDIVEFLKKCFEREKLEVVEEDLNKYAEMILITKNSYPQKLVVVAFDLITMRQRKCKAVHE